MVGVITKRFSDWTDQSRFNNPQFFMGMEVSTFQIVSPCIQLVDSWIAWIFKSLDSLTCQTVDRARLCLNCRRYWCCKRYDVACPHPATNSETLELDTFVSCFRWPTAVFSGSLRLWCWIWSVGKRMVKWQEGEMIPGQSKIFTTCHVLVCEKSKTFKLCESSQEKWGGMLIVGKPTFWNMMDVYGYLMQPLGPV